LSLEILETFSYSAKIKQPVMSLIDTPIHIISLQELIKLSSIGSLINC